MNKPFWVLENLDTVPRHRLFGLLGVEWLATPYAWLSLLLHSALGVLLAFLIRGIEPKISPWWAGLGYGLLLYLTNSLHSLGHILSGSLVGQPMDANLLTATFDVNLYYGDQSSQGRKVHLGRAAGGPLLNLLVGLLSLGLWRRTGWTGGQIFAYANLLSGLGTLLPIPPLDGWAIWKQILERKRNETGG